ncbi:MAG TPA: NACHT domain-containing protein [Anaerolineae bacterium]|nr:NACHT domain-containing protein [Anaerolineae bacterium]
MRYFRPRQNAPATAVNQSPNPGPLSRQMSQLFSRDELRSLCLTMHINPEEMPEGALTAQCTWLIHTAQGENRLPELLALLTAERPQVNWQTPIVPTNRDLRNRENVLQNIYVSWIEGYLQPSLAGGPAIDLRLTVAPTAVARKTPHVSGQADRVVEQPLFALFEEVGRSLLILGEPGSGKTITLLQLAEVLLAEARSDPGQPIPVILNLASWGQGKRPLAEWLVEELFSQYGVPRSLSRTWIEQNQWLYLLDGLDEVADEVQAGCVAAINEFRGEYPAEMVVCSRAGEYEQLKQKLNLATAVHIQALSDEQVGGYLDGQEGLVRDPELSELAHSPLFLGIMALAFRGASDEKLASLASGGGGRGELFARYVGQMFARRPLPEDARYDEAQARQWLIHLAQGLQQHSQTIFAIEQLQPDWLRRRQWLCLAVVGFLSGFMIGPFQGVTEFLIGTSLAGTVINGLLYGIAAGGGGAAAALLSAGIQKRWLRIFTGGLLSWLIAAFLTAVFASLILLFRPLNPNSFVLWLLLALARGVSLLFIGGLVARNPHIEPVETIRFAGPDGRRLAGELKKGCLGGLVFGLVGGWVFLTAAGVIYNTMIVPREPLVLGVVVGLVWGVVFSVVGAVFGGLLGVLVMAGAAFLQKGVAKSVRPNQGMRGSLQTAVQMTVLAGIVSGLLGWFFLQGIDGTLRGIVFIWGYTLPVVFLYFGGLAVIRHLCLRWFLAGQQVLPGRLASFLDEMTDRILLRRVGGSWVFVHRALLEYFAALSRSEWGS